VTAGAIMRRIRRNMDRLIVRMNSKLTDLNANRPKNCRVHASIVGIYGFNHVDATIGTVKT